MNTQQLKGLAQRVKYCDFSVNDSGYGVISSEGTFADCLGMDEASFIYAANPRVVFALIERLEAAERERDELRSSQEHEDECLIDALASRDEWRMRAVTAEAEIARRDAAASDELSRLREWVKCVEAERDKAISWHSSLLEKYNALINAPPAVFPQGGVAKALRDCDWSGVSIGNKAIIQAAIEALCAQPQKPVVLPEIIRHELIDVLTWIERLPVPTRSAAAKAIRLRKAISDIDAANTHYEVKK